GRKGRRLTHGWYLGPDRGSAAQRPGDALARLPRQAVAHRHGQVSDLSCKEERMRPQDLSTRTCTGAPATRHAPGTFLGSGAAAPAPEAPDPPQFPLHGARRTTQTGGDLLDGETFHLPDGHRAEDVVAELAEQTAALVGQQGGEFRRRLTTDDLDG